MTEQCKLLTKMAACSAPRLTTFKSTNRGNNIKLCGYLKKKRNKVGGWRKMWFVLQDKLLLSYASKEEYDNKLVSFKDVLNLMPGTMVRPLSGYRFTIETTTHALYTFHCEDRLAYREWITTLLDSLTAPAVRLKAQAQAQRVYNSYSMDNLPMATNLHSQRIMPTMTHSFECIALKAAHRLTTTTTTKTSTTITTTIAANRKNCVPIAQRSEKFLEHNVNNSVQSAARLQQAAIGNWNKQATAMNCCLQQCCNNNNNNNNNNKNKKHANKVNYNNNNSSSNNKNICSDSSDLFESLKVKAAINKNYENQSCFRSKQSLVTQKTAAAAAATVNNYYKTCSNACSNMNFKPIGCCTKLKPTTDLAISRRNRSNLVVATETTSCLLGTSHPIHCLGEKLNTLSLEEVRHLPLVTTDNAKAREARARLKEEPIYAVVNLQHKYAQRQQRVCCAARSKATAALPLKRCNSYDSILATCELDTKEFQQKSASLNEHDDIDGIYEDSETLIDCLNNKQFLDDDNSSVSAEREEENIYEPINVRHAPRKTLWRYITHLKVTPLLQLKRQVARRHKDNASHYESIKPAKIVAATSSTSCCSKHKNNMNTATTHLNTLKHKFGTHRRSMQLRMRKLCARGSGYVAKPFFKPFPKQQQQQQPQTEIYNNKNNNSSNSSKNCNLNTNKCHKKKSHYRWKSIMHNDKKPNVATEKRFFNSLKHIKKPTVTFAKTQKS